MVSQSDIFPDLEQVRLLGHSQARKTHTTDKGPLVFVGFLLWKGSCYAAQLGLRTWSPCISSMSAGIVGVLYHHGLWFSPVLKVGTLLSVRVCSSHPCE